MTAGRSGLPVGEIDFQLKQPDPQITQICTDISFGAECGKERIVTADCKLRPDAPNVFISELCAVKWRPILL